MKHKTISKACKVGVFACTILSMSAQAGLINRGNGMIYDDVLDVTWLQDANYARTSGFSSTGQMDFESSNNWVSNLVYGGFDDWRLPTLRPKNGTAFNFGFTFDGSTDRGFNQSSEFSELLHMFSENLGNTFVFDTSGNVNQPGSETFNTDFRDALTDELFSFSNIGDRFWTGLRDDPIFNAAWAVAMRIPNGDPRASGETQLLSTSALSSAWVVRDGDVMPSLTPAPDPIPQASSPATVGLSGIAALGIMCGYRRLYGMTLKVLRLTS